MPPATTLHDITTLVQSSHPLIAIETVEEERNRDLLRHAADDLSAPLFEWSLTRGLQRVPGGQAIHGTADLLGVTEHLRALTVDGLFRLKEFAV